VVALGSSASARSTGQMRALRRLMNSDTKSLPILRRRSSPRTFAWSTVDPSTASKSQESTFFTRYVDCSSIDGSMILSRTWFVWPHPFSSLERLFSSIPRGRIWTRFSGRSWEQRSGLCPLQDDKHLPHLQNPLRKNHTEEH